MYVISYMMDCIFTKIIETLGYELATLDVDNVTIYITCNIFPLFNKVILEEFTKALRSSYEFPKIRISVHSLFEKP